MTHLVDDLPRLGVQLRIVLGRLQLSELLEDAARELRPEQQRLQPGHDRVAAEHRHEPRHARCGQPPDLDAAVLLRPDPQSRKVGDRLRDRALEVVPVGAQLRYAQLPRGERVPNVLELLAEAAYGRREDERPRPTATARRRRRAPSARAARARSRYVAHAPSTRLGGSERITCVAALPAGSASRNCRASASKRGSASAGSGGALSGSPNEKSYDFTVKMSAKSQPISSASWNETGSTPWFWIVMRSCIASPTKRERAIDSVSCGSVSVDGLRRKNAAE